MIFWLWLETKVLNLSFGFNFKLILPSSKKSKLLQLSDTNCHFWLIFYMGKIFLFKIVIKFSWAFTWLLIYSPLFQTPLAILCWISTFHALSVEFQLYFKSFKKTETQMPSSFPQLNALLLGLWDFIMFVLIMSIQIKPNSFSG